MPDDLRAVHFNIDNQRAEMPHRAVAAGRAHPAAPRRHRLPRPPPGPRRPRAGRRAGRRRDRGQHPAPPPLLRQGVAADPPRPDRRPHRRHREPAVPRQRHHRPLPGGTRASRNAATAHHCRPARQLDRGPARRRHARGRAHCLLDGARGHAHRRAAVAHPRPGWRGGSRPLRVQPWADVPTLECVLVDGSGEAITLVFLGRRSIPGIRSGTQHRGRGHGGQAPREAGHDQPPLRAAARSPSRRDRTMSGGRARRVRARARRPGAVTGPPALVWLGGRGRARGRGRRSSSRAGAISSAADDALDPRGGHRGRGLVGHRGPPRRWPRSSPPRRSTSSSPVPTSRSASAGRRTSPPSCSSSWSACSWASWPPAAGGTGAPPPRDAIDLSRIHDMAERIAGGEEPDFVLMAVASELRDLLALQDCRFVWDPPSGKGAWIDPDGTVRLNPLRWPTTSAGLPTRQVELPVRGAGGPWARSSSRRPRPCPSRTSGAWWRWRWPISWARPCRPGRTALRLAPTLC